MHLSNIEGPEDIITLESLYVPLLERAYMITAFLCDTYFVFTAAIQ